MTKRGFHSESFPGERDQPSNDAHGRKSNGSTGAAREQLVFTRLDQIEPRAIDWLWPGRLARRKLALIAGDPGLGKSQVGIDIGARLTTRAPWPDAVSIHYPNSASAPDGSVIVLSAEDTANDTLRPRFDAAGADVARVEVLTAAIDKDGHHRTFSLQADLDALARKVRDMADVALVMIDPITSYMGKIDGHKTNEVRAVLEPVADFADDLNVAMLGISHPPKAAPAKAINAITGSLAYVAAARLVFMAIEEPDGNGRRLLLPTKNNIGALAPGLGFRLAQRLVTNDIVASHVVWDSEPVNMSADEAMAAGSSSSTARIADAKDFLRDALANGPRSAAEITEQAEADGIKERTLRRARGALNIIITKLGFADGWQWELPPDTRGGGK
jgi:hypothetical protein